MAKPKSSKVETINERVYLEVSRELDIPIKVIKDVILNGQSKFTAATMASNTFDGVRWPYFGTFKAKHKVVQVLNYMKGLDPVQKQFFKDMTYLKYKAMLQNNVKPKRYPITVINKLKELFPDETFPDR